MLVCRNGAKRYNPIQICRKLTDIKIPSGHSHFCPPIPCRSQPFILDSRQGIGGQEYKLLAMPLSDANSLSHISAAMHDITGTLMVDDDRVCLNVLRHPFVQFALFD